MDQNESSEFARDGFRQLRAEVDALVRQIGGEVIVPEGSTWKWLHPTDGTDPATSDTDFHTTFFKADYDDSHWQTGKDRAGADGGFGYGDPVGVDIGTPPALEDRKTAYFRHSFRRCPVARCVSRRRAPAGLMNVLSHCCLYCWAFGCFFVFGVCCSFLGGECSPELFLDPVFDGFVADC